MATAIVRWAVAPLAPNATGEHREVVMDERPDRIDRTELDELLARLEHQEQHLRDQDRDLAALRAEMARLRAPADTPTPGEVAVLERDGHATPPTGGRLDESDPTPGDLEAGSPGVVGRRHLLRAGAAAAGVAVAGTTLLASGDPAEAATVIGSGNPGVRGDGLGGDGVAGNTNQPGASGVYGNTATAGAVGITGRHLADGTAIEGISTGTLTGIGVMGRGALAGIYGIANGVSEAVGVVGNGTIGGLFEGDAANLLITRTTLNPPPTLTSFNTPGFLVNDKDGALWFCAIAGTPGTWREVAGPTSAGSFHLLPASARIYDSRPGEAPLGVTKGLLANGAERSVLCLQGTGAGVVPLGTTGIAVNVTVTSTSAAGWVSVFRAGIAWPGTSTINWAAPNTTIANSTVVALSSLYQFTLKVSPGSSTHVIVDALGYYR
jgi:hypothetical protein